MKIITQILLVIFINFFIGDILVENISKAVIKIYNINSQYYFYTVTMFGLTIEEKADKKEFENRDMTLIWRKQ